jgi:hypothetical protein
MKKTAQEIATIVVYTMKIAQAFEDGEAEFDKEAGLLQSAPKYRVADRLAIRRAGLGGNVDSQHLAEGVYKERLPIEAVVKAVRGMAKKLKAQRAQGPRAQIPNKQNWYREIRDASGKVEGYLAGWGPRIRTVYNAAMGKPRGIPQ